MILGHVIPLNPPSSGFVVVIYIIGSSIFQTVIILNSQDAAHQKPLKQLTLESVYKYGAHTLGLYML